MILKHLHSFIFVIFILAIGVFNSSINKEEFTDWEYNHNSKIRIILSEVKEDFLFIGLNISLFEDSYTYWKNPGDMGVQPQIEIIDNNSNISNFEIKWPVPELYRDEYGTSYIYRDEVIIPILIKPHNVEKTMDISMKITYGVCNKVCVPINEKLSFKLDYIKNNIKKRSPLIVNTLSNNPKRRNDNNKIIANSRLIEDGRARYIRIDFRDPINQIFIHNDHGYYLSDAQEYKAKYDNYLYRFDGKDTDNNLYNKTIEALIITDKGSFIEDFTIQ